MTEPTVAPEPFPTIDIYEKNPNQYLDRARQLVLEHYNHHYLEVGEELHISELYVVWFTKTLKNWKALVATEVVNDGMYFEVTHNGDLDETYLDAYKKVSNETISTTGRIVNTQIIDWRNPKTNANQHNWPRTGAVDANGDPVG